ncbi:hypothetical protein HK104_001013 [Borealophlyctis nickersoniae]|nr:hypothetical protein HK104_001013 [Borealophlyctis nickersoniae]
MKDRLDALNTVCSPNAPFALLYYQMTLQLRDGIAGNYFDDNNLMSTFTVHFARKYLNAYDGYYKGTGGDVPPTWRTAFEYADAGMSSTMSNLLEGMNAHINYDLGMTVYELSYGIPANKKDYDRINDLLAKAAGPATEAIAAKYDWTQQPTAANTITDPLILNTLFGWRENAWNFGVSMMEAQSDAEREVKRKAMLDAATLTAVTVADPAICPTRASQLQYCLTGQHGLC